MTPDLKLISYWSLPQTNSYKIVFEWKWIGRYQIDFLDTGITDFFTELLDEKSSSNIWESSVTMPDYSPETIVYLTTDNPEYLIMLKIMFE
jgi:hypothetical protein